MRVLFLCFSALVIVTVVYDGTAVFSFVFHF